MYLILSFYNRQNMPVVFVDLPSLINHPQLFIEFTDNAVSIYIIPTTKIYISPLGILAHILSKLIKVCILLS